MGVRQIAWRLGLCAAGLVFFFGWFAPAVDAAYIHYVRTPVVAMLTDDCGEYDLGNLTCHATWMLDGEVHDGWVTRKDSGSQAEVFNAGVVDDDFVYPDPGVSAVDRGSLGIGVALPFVVALVLVLRRWRGTRVPLRTILLSPVIALGGVTVATGVVLYAVTLNLRDPVQAQRGGLLIAAGAVLLLAGLPVWWPAIRRAQERSALRARNARVYAQTRPTGQTVGPLPAPADPSTMWWKDPTAVSPALSAAVALAAREMPLGEPLTTGRLLSAVALIDTSGDWQRVWLLVGDPANTGLATTPDSAEPAPGPTYQLLTPPTWGGTRLSNRLVQALWLADRIAATYRLRPVPPGAVALALLAHRGNGATEALLAPGTATHAQLLMAVQTDILKTTLANLSALVPAAR